MKISGYKLIQILLVVQLFGSSNSILAQVPYVGGIIINEIDIENHQVELYNPTNQAIDVTSWRLCVDSTHTVVFIQPLIGSRLMQPGDNLIVEWYQINDQMHELALYIPYGQLANPINIQDYVQIGGIGQPNAASVAVAAGVWDDINAYVSYPGPAMTISHFNDSASNGTSTNSNHWFPSLPSIGSDNGCIPGFFSALGNALTGSIESDAEFVTNGIIESSQTINAMAEVSYNAATEILLIEGFEVSSNNVLLYQNFISIDSFALFYNFIRTDIFIVAHQLVDHSSRSNFDDTITRSI